MRAQKIKLLFLVALLSPVVALSQSTPMPEPTRDAANLRPLDRITLPVDETQRVALRRSRHPLAKPENMVGQVMPGTILSRMVLVLRPDSAQDAALEELLRAQQDPGSRSYHQWLTPQAFGEQFGVSENDLAQVVNWLETHGMKVEEIPASHRSIVFSGTAGQVESAFHTVLRKYSVNGEMHYANATDAEIPRALAEVVRGVYSLHDFRSKSAHTDVPAYTLANGVHVLMPHDWATIYDVLPLYSQGLDGSGQSIAVVGRTDLALSDSRTFRANAGLPAKDPVKIFVNGINPGMPDCVDEAESALDVEWAGAVAKNATIDFVTAQSGATDGVVLAAQYAVTNNVAPIITMSYLHCENTLSDGGQGLWGSLWAEAAAQGQSVFVASGDSGAAGCDLCTETTAALGKGVNAICSTPNSTCVGGTQFNDVYNPGAYWTATNGAGMSSALSYIPEVAWNESGWSNSLDATGGGVSTIYPKPGWQGGPGVPADGKRDVPDVAMSSAIHDAYVIEIQGGPFYVAGTSAAAPSLASVMALVLQNTGARQGNINPALYLLASQQATAGGPAIFHDITSGNNSVPGLAGYTAGPGYDLTTGLGSVDAFLLVNNWNNSTTADFSLGTSASSLTVVPGSSAQATLSLNPENGFFASATLSASGAPSGVSMNFSSSRLSASAPVTMTFSPDASAAGTWPITITATGGGLQRTTSVTLSVPAPTFTLTPQSSSLSVATGASTSVGLSTAAANGFNSALSLAVTGLPAGVTAGFAPAGIGAPGNGNTTLTLSAASGTAPGVYHATMTAAGGSVTKTCAITLTVIAPGFNLAVSNTSATIAPGGSKNVTLVTSPVNGFNAAVVLSVRGLPNGVTATFSPSTIAAPGAGSAVMSISVASNAAAGTYPLTLSGTGGSLSKSQPLSLIVLGTFALSSSSSSASTARGGSASFPLSTLAGTGFHSSINLSVSGVPSGVTARFSSASIPAPGSGSSTLTLSANATAAPGSYSVTVTASGGGISKSLALRLTVLTPGFALSANTTHVTVAPGGSARLTLTTVLANGFNSAVALSTSGAPAGVTAGFAPVTIGAPGGGNSTLTFTAASTRAPCVATVTVIASGGGVRHTQTITLTVATAPASAR